VYKTRLFVLEIVLLLHETQNEQNPITNLAVPKIIVTFTSTIYPEVSCRSSDISVLVDTLPKTFFMSMSDGFVFTSTSLCEKINGSGVGGLTLL